MAARWIRLFISRHRKTKTSVIKINEWSKGGIASLEIARKLMILAEYQTKSAYAANSSVDLSLTFMRRRRQVNIIIIRNYLVSGKISPFVCIII